jgi:hypothetical protein
MQPIDINDGKRFVLKLFLKKPYAGARIRQTMVADEWARAGMPPFRQQVTEMLVAEGLLEFQNAGVFLALTANGVNAL